MIADVVALFLTGFVSLIGQIVLLRELNVAFFGVELIYLIALGVWLLLTALGTIAGRRRNAPSPGRSAILFLLFSLCLPLGVAILRGSRLALGGVPGAYLPILWQMVALVIALAPVGLLSGFLFRNAAGLYAVKGRTLAGAYGVESAGALIGGILAALRLRWGIQNFSLAVTCSLIAVGNGSCCSWPKRKTAAAARRPGRLCPSGPPPVAGRPDRPDYDGLEPPGTSRRPATPPTHGSPSRPSPDRSRCSKTTPSPSKPKGPRRNPSPTWPPCSIPTHAASSSSAGGIDGTIRELLRHRPAQIDWVEIDPVLIAMTGPLLPDGIQASLGHRTVQLITADPRRLLRGKR